MIAAAASGLLVVGTLTVSAVATQAPAGAATVTKGAHLSLPALVAPARQVARPVPTAPAPVLAPGTVRHMARRASRFGASAVAPKATTPAATYVVTSVADSPLANPASKACVDLATHTCSLRAAVQAANNLDKPAVIVLGAHTYTLSDSLVGALVVQNAGGTTIEGKSEASTRIVVPGGNPYGVIAVVEPPSDAGATVFLSNLTLSGGTATDGGGLSVVDENVAAILDSVNITGNTGTSAGGGVYCDAATIWATNSAISGNQTPSAGGGMYNYWCNTFLTNTNVNGDTATTGTTSAYGGGIYNYYGNFRMVGGSVSNDTAGNATYAGSGGGISDYYSGDTISGGTVLKNDTAAGEGTGGGIAEYYSQLFVAGATLTGDRALGTLGSGGAVGTYESTQVQLHGVTMAHDTTQATDNVYGGGAVNLYSSGTPSPLTIDSCTITSDNTTAVVLAASEGGIDANISNSKFQGNSSSLTNAGGAIFANAFDYGDVKLGLVHDSFIANASGGEYGAGAVEAYSGQYGSTSIDMTADTVKNNVAGGSEGAGGIAGIDDKYGSVSVDIAGSSISGNKSTNDGYGGGVGVWQFTSSGNASLMLNHDMITGNTARGSGSGYGGGVMVYDYASLTAISTTISGNVATGTDGYGGGIYSNTYVGSQLIGDTLSNNHATGPAGAGGGMYTNPEYGSAQVVGSTFASNTANQGAGIFIYEYQMDVSGSTFSGNVAGTPGAFGEGGAIYDEYSICVFTNTTFANNVAVSSHTTVGKGGAIFNYDAVVSLYYDTIASNAAVQGSAIYDIGTGVVRDSIIVANHTTPSSKTESDCFATGIYGVLSSAGGNVLSRPNCVRALAIGDVVTAKPVVLALANNGGPTKTMALAVKSAALGAAHGDRPLTDQRGVVRPKVGSCDSGAFQH